LLTDKAQRLDFLSRRLKHPGEDLRRQRESLRLAEERLRRQLQVLFEQRRWRLQLAESRLGRHRPDLAQHVQQLDRLSEALHRAGDGWLNRQRLALARLSGTLEAMNPQAVLERGYAIVQKADGRAVRSPLELLNHERVTLQLAEGRTEAIIDHPAGAQPELPF
ncbi:MAG TPA: exodeoxyribonuclease VII large subunit, partial [Pseudogulbenkiania sp.]|nr:exodeoxyribonuclease VII large subunit [Pseudogulbenkiania sp.]